MNDLGESHFVLGIKIARDRNRKLMGLSQRGYIEMILTRFNMEKCNGCHVPVNKRDHLSKEQCPRTDFEVKKMSEKPYASLVGSLMYANVCTRPDIAYIVKILGRFQSNPEEAHWSAVKKVLRYLQQTKGYMLVYGREEELELKGYTDSNLAGDLDDRKSTGGYIFFVWWGYSVLEECQANYHCNFYYRGRIRSMF
ncbi:hypothetical protein ACFXTN_032150 [Malus domestica]